MLEQLYATYYGINFNLGVKKNLRDAKFVFNTTRYVDFLFMRILFWTRGFFFHRGGWRRGDTGKFRCYQNVYNKKGSGEIK